MEDFGGDGTSEAVLGLLGTSGLVGGEGVGSFVIGVLEEAICVDIDGGCVRMADRDVVGAEGVGEGMWTAI